MIAVDYFAGAGGWSTGATAAGARVAAAVNHWPIAVASHRANHPEALHLCQDAALLDPASLPAFDVLLASPSCQGHSRARGTDQPRHDASRATAWCVVDAAEVRRPRLVLVENVPDFLRWQLFPAWRAALEALGYALTVNVLNAADFGVPQERERMFLVARRGKALPPIASPCLRHVPAREIIDLDAGTWTPTASKVEATQARIEDGRRRFGRAPFLIAYYGEGSGKIARSLDRPLGTLTTIDRYAIVRGDEMRMLSVDECRRAMGFPAGYVITGTRRDRIMQLGNAVCPPVARAVVEQVADAA